MMHIGMQLDHTIDSIQNILLGSFILLHADGWVDAWHFRICGRTKWISKWTNEWM